MILTFENEEDSEEWYERYCDLLAEKDYLEGKVRDYQQQLLDVEEEIKRMGLGQSY